MKTHLSLALSALFALSLSACAADAPDPDVRDSEPELEAEPTPDPQFAGCTRDTLEDDLQMSPLMGPAVSNGELAPGDYIVTTTYLQIKADKNGRLEELLGPVMADLGTRDGLLALAFGNSGTCNAARTLAAWRDETAMLEFVVSEAHAAAMASASELNRGGSATTHWNGDSASVSWITAAERLAVVAPSKY